jgi:hypothetical protein
MAADLFIVPTTRSTDPLRLVRQRKLALENLNFRRKQLDRAIESVQRLLELRQRGANAGYPLTPLPLVARRTNLLQFPGPARN